MTYSCSDFTDTILNALDLVVPEEAQDNPSAQADLALERIAQLRALKADDVRGLLNKLLEWNEHVAGPGGHESAVWDEARKFRDGLFPPDAKPAKKCFQVIGTIYLGSGFDYVVEADTEAEAEKIASARAWAATWDDASINEVCIESTSEMEQ